MTHLHLATLGQCLVSLARQGIKEPLYRILRFAESGAIVTNSKKPNNESSQDSNLNKSLCKSANSSSIQTDQVKVSFKKSAAILDQINQIQQLPDPQISIKEESPKNIVYPPNYSVEEQCQDLQKIYDQVSQLERYLNTQLVYIHTLQNIWSKFNSITQMRTIQLKLRGKQNFLPFISKKLYDFNFSELVSQNQLEEFLRLQQDIYSNVSQLNDPLKSLLQ